MADKTIKNPLRKRILRDIRKEKGKYISIFLFLTFMISIVSGMLVTSLSMMHTYDDGIYDIQIRQVLAEAVWNYQGCY